MKPPDNLYKFEGGFLPLWVQEWNQPAVDDATMKNSLRILCLLSFLPPSGVSIGQIPTDSLVAYFPFNGNANDEIGNSDGTVDGATPTVDRFGKAISAYYFNGSSHIQGVSTAFNFSIQPFSISSWIRSSSSSSQAIFTTHDLSLENYSNIGLYLAGSDSSFADFDINNGQGSLTNFNGRSVNDGLWHHIVVVRTGNTANIYVDNQLDFTDTLSQDPLNSTLFMIGSNTGGAYFDGNIDDIRIYARALNSDEIQSLYYEEDDLKLHVPFQYATIQAALNATQSGDTVVVQPGTYYENIFLPNTNGISLGVCPGNGV